MNKKTFELLQNFIDSNDEVSVGNSYIGNPIVLSNKPIESVNENILRIRENFKEKDLKEIPISKTFESFIEGKNGEHFLVCDTVELNTSTKMWESYTRIFDCLTQEEMDEIKNKFSTNNSFNERNLKFSKLKIFTPKSSNSTLYEFEDYYLVNASMCHMSTNISGRSYEFFEKNILPANLDFDSWLAIFRTNSALRDRGIGRTTLNRAERIVRLLNSTSKNSIKVSGEMVPLDGGFIYDKKKQGSMPVQNARGRFESPESAYAILKHIYERLGFKVTPCSFTGARSGDMVYMTILEKELTLDAQKTSSAKEGLERE